MKKIVLLFVSIAFSVLIYAQTANIKLYVDTYKEIAINEEIRSGVPAAITLAQGILESGCGQSELCRQSNNHFGVKCKENWTGPTVMHDDDRKGECFRVYANAAESFKDHSDFLKYRPYYVDLFKLAQDDYKGWAYGLKKAGYATERDYPQNLIRLIETYNLQQYTLTAMQRMQNPNQATYASKTVTEDKDAVVETQPAVETAMNNNNTAAIQSTDSKEESDSVMEDNATIPVTKAVKANEIAYPEGVFTINGTKVVFAKTGTSLFAMASNYSIAYKSLLDFNELANEDVLARDRLIYLERKPKKCTKDFHTVCDEETIEDIAQKEGIRLESLMEYNAIKKGTQLNTGAKIYLKLMPGMAVKSRKA